PENFLADGGMAIGPIMEGLDIREITAYVSAKSNAPGADNPVRRDDLTQPVPEDLWSRLPKNPQGQLDKSCFVPESEGHEPQTIREHFKSGSTTLGDQKSNSDTHADYSDSPLASV